MKLNFSMVLDIPVEIPGSSLESFWTLNFIYDYDENEITLNTMECGPINQEWTDFLKSVDKEADSNFVHQVYDQASEHVAMNLDLAMEDYYNEQD